ncbi:hypothetical protein QQP08_022282 [Theobroma cacao]|nr:hypothetical protein QQP08_022282 [Theobroma cacao]
MDLDDMLTNNVKVNSKRRRSINARPKFDKFDIVNSCNGLLCLSEPVKYNPVIVCNLITGEFIKIPEAPEIAKPSLQMADLLFAMAIFTAWEFEFKLQILKWMHVSPKNEVK